MCQPKNILQTCVAVRFAHFLWLTNFSQRRFYQRRKKIFHTSLSSISKRRKETRKLCTKGEAFVRILFRKEKQIPEFALVLVLVLMNLDHTHTNISKIAFVKSLELFVQFIALFRKTRQKKKYSARM